MLRHILLHRRRRDILGGHTCAARGAHVEHARGLRLRPGVLASLLSLRQQVLAAIVEVGDLPFPLHLVRWRRRCGGEEVAFLDRRSKAALRHLLQAVVHGVAIEIAAVSIQYAVWPSHCDDRIERVVPDQHVDPDVWHKLEEVRGEVAVDAPDCVPGLGVEVLRVHIAQGCLENTIWRLELRRVADVEDLHTAPECLEASLTLGGPGIDDDELLVLDQWARHRDASRRCLRWKTLGVPETALDLERL
mmetsp:Transcript_41640/g.120228  ORF Transcript_41640/g.120228 Transcript_41640/m.120228 type:complete len:247 (-) Transcript_41640:616-1356(-)